MSKQSSGTPAPPKQKKSPTNSTPDAPALGDLLHILQPLIAFHKEVEDASSNDLRIYWDVRVVRGASETFMTSNGSSSLPDALGAKSLPTASSMIQQEVLDKIATPLVGKMQAFVETGALESATKRKVHVLTDTPKAPLMPGAVVTLANSLP